MPTKSRQALILIHGIGEQQPMETLRGFVDAILPPRGTEGTRYYNKPDLLSDNLELRRLVSAGGRNERTDFYEFYWAHLMPTAAWDRLISWYSVLMWRRWRDVSPKVRSLWLVSWLITIAALGVGLFYAWRFLHGDPIMAGWTGKRPWLIIAVGMLIIAVCMLISTVLRSYAGDAAIYLRPSPRNIETRQKIRSAGLKLLDRIVASKRYDRIIIVGHSLGSVIGYDILTFAWQRYNETALADISAKWQKGEFPGRKSTTAIRRAEAVAKDIRVGPAHSPEQMRERAAKWQSEIREIQAERKARGDGWLVTDFVTLGSPLAHGAMLLARNRADFDRRIRERELPCCPPVWEKDGKFSFKYDGQDNQGRPQHTIALHDAAVFAVVNWTNLYFPCCCVVKGDVVGGPIAPLFGPGVRDIDLKTHICKGFLAHTHYWQSNDKDTVQAPLPCLREALDLGRRNRCPAALTGSATKCN